MIAKMKRFYLFFTRNPESILSELQKESFVEIDRLPETFGFEHSGLEKAELEEKINQLDFLKGLLKTIEGKDFSGKVVLTEEEEQQIIEGFPLSEIYEKFLGMVKEKSRREKVSNRISELKKELDTIRYLTFAPCELFLLKNFDFCLVSIDRRKHFTGKVVGLYAEKVGAKDKQVFWIVVFPKYIREKVFSEIEEMQGKILPLKPWNKKPVDVIEKLNKVLEKNQMAEKAQEQKIKELVIFKNRIFVYYDHLKSLFYYLGAQEKFGSSKFTKGCSGWVKEKDVARLEKFIDKRLPEAYLYIETPDLEENVPIAFENTKIVEPFEVITDLYGRPIYKNIDPTGPLSLFFAISFAFCLTDAGYGLLLVLLAWILMKKFRLIPSVVKFLRLLLYSGIATVFMGVITGSWFGDMLKRLPGALTPVRFLNSLVIIDPLEGGNNTFIFLGWAILIGYLQIVWGLMLNVYNKVKYYGIKQSGEAFCLLAIQILVGILIAVFVLKQRCSMPSAAIIVPVGLLVVSFAYFMKTKAQEQKGPMMKIFWAFYGVYNVIAGNLLGDILSYSRLFGLALTTSVLGLVINNMAFMLKGIPYAGYILACALFILGHIGNLVINMFGSYVHTSRLQYLEFFTKFFESGGRPFTPFSYSRRYTFISKDT